MSSTDFISILGNLSQSLIQVESLITGFGYVLGIALTLTGFLKLTKISKHSQEKPAVAMSYILGGASLIFLPTSIDILSNTIFGASSALEYTTYNPYDITSIMTVIVQTSGLIWFVRGAVLMVNASQPGQQHGVKGFLFILAGILSINVQYTSAALTSIFNYFMGLV